MTQNIEKLTKVKSMEYVIVSDESIHNLSILVNGRIRNGWEPLGGISSGKTYDLNVFVQAMIKK